MFRQLDEVAALSDPPGAEDAFEASEGKLTSEEYIRVQALDRLARGGRGPFRPLLMVKDESLIGRVRAIAAEAPHFSEAIEIVARAAMLARATGTALQLPHLLLAGPPGVGKTWFSKRLAAAIGTNTESIAGNAITDAALLLGHPSSWKGAKQGVVTDILVRSKSASPIILMDEVDKLKTHYSEDPFNVLLTLLEPENASKAMDEYLLVPFDLSRIIWILTANDLEHIPAPILDRTLVLHIEPPEGERFADLVRNIFRDVVQRFGEPPYTAGDAVIRRLATKRPRRIVRLIELALGYAAEAGRREVIVADIAKAEAFFSAPEPEAEHNQDGVRARHGRRQCARGKLTALRRRSFEYRFYPDEQSSTWRTLLGRRKPLAKG